VRYFKFDDNMLIIAGTLHEDLCAAMMLSPLILVRTRNVSNEICIENQNNPL